jgi:hypothetical protein
MIAALCKVAVNGEIDEFRTRKTTLTSEVDKRQWVRARDAFDKILEHLESPYRVESDLFLHLRHGRLSARANRYWLTNETVPSLAWKACPKATKIKEIPTSVWRLENNIIEDRSRWRFPVGKFLMTKRDGRRIMMSGVSFLLSDLRKLYPKIFGREGRSVTLLKSRRVRGAGGQHSPVNLSDLTLDWISLATEGKLGDVIGVLKVHGMKTKFVNLIYERCEGLNIEPLPSSATCYRWINKLFKADEAALSKLLNETKETKET